MRLRSTDDAFLNRNLAENVRKLIQTITHMVVESATRYVLSGMSGRLSSLVAQPVFT